MALEVAFGWCSHPGPRPVNEDWAAAAVGKGRDQDRGAIVAIADGVSTGGDGREAARTTVMRRAATTSRLPIWDTSVVLDRLIDAQNAWLAAHNAAGGRPGRAGGGDRDDDADRRRPARPGLDRRPRGRHPRLAACAAASCIQLTQDHCLRARDFRAAA